MAPSSMASDEVCNTLECCYEPFMLDGLVSLSGSEVDQCPVCILRDVLPFSDGSSCDSSVLVQGIEMSFVSVPLHQIHLDCGLAKGVFKVGVCPSLPVRGVTFLLGNDIAGGRVMPVLEVLERPKIILPDVLAQEFPEVFSVCAVTRAQARRLGEVVDLSETMFATESSDMPASLAEFIQPTNEKSDKLIHCNKPIFEKTHSPVTRSDLIAAQKEDSTLAKCFALVVAPEMAKTKEVAYYIENGLLMRRWKSRVDLENEWSYVVQIVLPTPYRQSVLSLAHDHLWSGHLGVTKTYDRVLKHFFWPGLKRDVASFCRTCHACQVTGKPNQVIKPAPLYPIPAMGEPFEHVLVDCVGPLPKA